MQRVCRLNPHQMCIRDRNKYVWDNSVDDYILLKSNEEYFNDPVCKNGYFRGVETYNFVKEVMSRGEEMCIRDRL